MQYIISFFEGIITFISPCLLPMLPVYLSYFAAGEEKNLKKTLKNALGFILGFTLVFMALGLFAGSLGALLRRWETAVNIIAGAVVVVFGLSFMGLFDLFGKRGRAAAKKPTGFFSALAFGAVFSISWTPCVGVFLGSALMLAGARGSALEGALMLLCYSAGLGLPFLLGALLIDRLKSAFDWIKRNYRVINIVCGALLVAMGLLMMSGLLTKWLGLLA